MLDASGFVRRSQVFAGNVREHHTLAEMLDALNAPRAALVVMDRGIATEDRVQWLREQGYRYLVVSRERTRHFDAEAAVPRNDSTRSGSASVGSKLKVAASPSTTTSNSTPTTPHNAPRPCASPGARSAAR